MAPFALRRWLRRLGLSSKPAVRRRPRRLLLEGLEERCVPTASLWTDLPDYPPGATAIIQGAGFSPGETVTLQVLHTDGLPNTGDAHAPWSVTDGGAGDQDGALDGSIQTSWTMDADAADSAFQVTATGQTSGETATAAFTDSVSGTSIVIPTGFSTLSVAPGGTATVPYAFTYVTGGSGVNQTTSITYNVYLRQGGTDYLIAGPVTQTGLPNGTHAVGSAGSPLTASVTFNGLGGNPPGTGGEDYNLRVEVTKNNGSNPGSSADNSSGNWVTVTAPSGSIASVSAGSQSGSAIYGGATDTVTYAVTAARAANGTFNGSYSVSGLPAGVTGSFSPTSITSVGNNPIPGTTLSLAVAGTVNAGAYTFTVTLGGVNGTGTLVVSPAPLSVVATNQTKVYGAALPALTYTYSGLVNGDLSASFTGGLATTATASSNVGDYPITQGTLAATGNYTIAVFADGTLSVTPAPLTITAAANTKVYDATTSAAAVPTVSGLQGSDTVTGLAEAYTDKNAGTGKTLTVTAYTVNDGNGGNNYTVTTVDDTTGVITAAPLTITATTNTKVYDATTSAAATPTVSGLQGTDTVTGLAEVYDNKNAGTGKTLSVSAYTVNDDNGGNNYSVTTVDDTTGVITAAPLTITAVTNTKVYDATTSAAATPTVAGLQGADTVTGLAETYDNKNVGTGKTLSVSAYAINDGNSGNNYTVTTVDDTTGVITAAPLTITATTNTKVYDATTSAAAVPTVSGLQGTDTVTGLAEAYTTASAGTGKTLTVTAYTVNDGNGGNNYTVTTVNDTTGVITPLGLTTDFAATQNALNVAKDGVIAFRIGVNAGGIVDAQTVASLFNGALFTLRVGTQTYSVQAQATVLDGIIHVSFHMTDELKAILAAHTTATSASTAPIVGLELMAVANGGNYILDTTAFTRLFNSTK